MFAARKEAGRTSARFEWARPREARPPDAATTGATAPFFACFGAHDLANASPIFKTLGCETVHQPDLATNRIDAATGEPQRLMHLFGFINHNKKKRVFFCHFPSPSC